MNLPYVIDNRAYQLAEVLNDLLQDDAVRALDVASATFNVDVARGVVVNWRKSQLGVPSSCSWYRSENGMSDEPHGSILGQDRALGGA